MSPSPGILLVGFGNMGQALANGWLGRGYVARHIAVVDPDDRARAAARALGLRVVDGETIDQAPADVVVLAVKPAQLGDSVEPMRAAALPGAVFLSIVAGKTTAQLAALLGGRPAVVRAMPNTPAAIGRGMTVLCANDAVSDAQRRICENLVAAVGSVEWVDDESLMDAVTAISGSGPAYVFLLIECLTEAARELGLPEDLAARLATGTVAGAGAYAEQSGVPARDLRVRVTSPQGTTQAALDVLQGAGGLAELLRRAVHAAAERSRALSSQ